MSPKPQPLDEASRSACAELALEEGAEFDLVHRFLSAETADRQLALEALFRSVRDVPLSVSDPSIGVAKIGWWQTELKDAATQGSQHPVVRALLATTALPAPALPHFQAYLMTLLLSLDADATAQVEDLYSALKASAGEEGMIILAEAADVPEAGDALEAGVRAACAAARLLELMRTLSRDHAEHAWLPLDLVARHRLKRQEAGDQAQRSALVASLADLALQWRTQSPLPRVAKGDSNLAFLLLRDRLVGRRLQRAKRAPERWLSDGMRVPMSDVFSSWRRARQLAGS